MSTAAVTSLGKEQFVAMYLSGGVISSFASFLYKVMLNQPGLSLGAVRIQYKFKKNKTLATFLLTNKHNSLKMYYNMLISS